jgi:Holliday junction resolvase RusA-like endonuclease
MVEVELIAQECIPDKPFQMIDIEFIWTEKGRGRDPDNMRTAAKFCIDAMVNQGIIPDDSMKYVKHITDKFMKGKERGVIVKWIGYTAE